MMWTITGLGAWQFLFPIHCDTYNRNVLFHQIRKRESGRFPQRMALRYFSKLSAQTCRQRAECYRTHK